MEVGVFMAGRLLCRRDPYLAALPLHSLGRCHNVGVFWSFLHLNTGLLDKLAALADCKTGITEQE